LIFIYLFTDLFICLFIQWFVIYICLLLVQVIYIFIYILVYLFIYYLQLIIKNIFHFNHYLSYQSKVEAAQKLLRLAKSFDSDAAKSVTGAKKSDDFIVALKALAAEEDSGETYVFIGAEIIFVRHSVDIRTWRR
jgi:hypothetical protein